MADALHTPAVGEAHVPDVRGEAEHAGLPDVQMIIPDCAQPPLPVDVHAPPSDTQLPPHRLVPDEQTVPHKPDEQICPKGHDRLHAPQLVVEVRVSTSQPSAATALQLA